jgi:hypothetical protein
VPYVVAAHVGVVPVAPPLAASSALAETIAAIAATQT